MPKARSPRRASATRTSRSRSTRPRKRITAAFVEALEAADGPVHVHCIANWRVSAFFYRYHRDACGMAEPEARALMERQWSPETSDYPGAPPWAALIAPEGALMDFHGQHIVVTGGSSGIGLVTAQLLASRGARVSLIARRQELLDEAVAGMGENAAGFAADVGDKAQLDGALEAAAARLGPIHGLFANAGLTGGFTPAVAFDPRGVRADHPHQPDERVLGDPEGASRR